MPQVSKRKMSRWSRYVGMVTHNGYANRDSARKSWKRLMAADKEEGLRLLNKYYPTLSLQANAQQTVLNFDDAKSTAEKEEKACEAAAPAVENGYERLVAEPIREEACALADALMTSERETSSVLWEALRTIQGCASGIYSKAAMECAKGEVQKEVYRRYSAWAKDHHNYELARAYARSRCILSLCQSCAPVALWDLRLATTTSRATQESEAEVRTETSTAQASTMTYACSNGTITVTCTSEEDRQWLKTLIEYLSKDRLTEATKLKSDEAEAESTLTPAEQREYEKALHDARLRTIEDLSKIGASSVLFQFFDANVLAREEIGLNHAAFCHFFTRIYSDMYNKQTQGYLEPLVWGVFLVALYRARYEGYEYEGINEKYERAYCFVGMPIKLTALGEQAKLAFNRYLDSPRPPSAPRIHVPTDYERVVHSLERNNYVLV